MPLTSCPDCHNNISDSAPACPYCGRPMAAAQPQRTANQVTRYQEPPTPMQQPTAPPPQAAPMMQPAQYQQSQVQQPIYHDPHATFIDPEEPFRNNSLIGAIKGQASFRATFLWWLVGFIGFGFLAFQMNVALAIIPAAIWFWGGIFLMFWNARNIYNIKLKRVVFWSLGIIFALLMIGAYGNG